MIRFADAPLRLAYLSADRGFQRLSQQERDSASSLAEMRNIPMVAQHMELMLEVQTDEFCEGVTTPSWKTCVSSCVP